MTDTLIGMLEKLHQHIIGLDSGSGDAKTIGDAILALSSYAMHEREVKRGEISDKQQLQALREENMRFAHALMDVREISGRKIDYGYEKLTTKGCL